MNVGELIEVLEPHEKKNLWLSQLEYDFSNTCPKIIYHCGYSDLICEAGRKIVIFPMNEGHCRSVQEFIDDINNIVWKENQANCKVYIRNKSNIRNPLTTLPIVEGNRVHLIYC